MKPQNNWQTWVLALLTVTGACFCIGMFLAGVFPLAISLTGSFLALVLGLGSGLLLWYFQHSRRLGWLFLALCIFCITLYSIGTVSLVRIRMNVERAKSAEEETVSVEVLAKKDTALNQVKKAGYVKDEQEAAVRQCLQKLELDGYSMITVPYESREKLSAALKKGEIQAMVLTDGEEGPNNMDVLFTDSYNPLSEPVVRGVNSLSTEPFQVLATFTTGWEDNGSADVNLLFTINPTKGKILITALPAETLVDVACPGRYACQEGKKDSLANTGLHSSETTRSTVESLLGTKIHYVVKGDMSGLSDFVDDLDGIKIPGNTDGYWLPEGEIPGYMAVSYLQHRGALKDGISVAEGVLNRMLDLEELDHLENAMSHVLSDLPVSSLEKLAKSMQEDKREWTYQVQTLEGTQIQAHSATQDRAIAVLNPDPASLKKIKANIEKTLQ